MERIISKAFSQDVGVNIRKNTDFCISRNEEEYLRYEEDFEEEKENPRIIPYLDRVNVIEDLDHLIKYIW